MIIGIPKELNQDETRSAITVGTVKSYTKFGFSVMVEAGASELPEDIILDALEKGREANSEISTLVTAASPVPSLVLVQ